jgi:hypothetical protein
LLTDPLRSASIQSLLATPGMAALIRDLKVAIAPLGNPGWLKRAGSR